MIDTSLELDPLAGEALDLARAAAVEFAVSALGEVGEHLGVQAEEAHVVTHTFAATVPGYVGWVWAVTLARPAESDYVTVDEVVLLPGPGALLAPAWVPWSERMRPGDLSPGDLVAPRVDDPRLVPAYAEFDPAEVSVDDRYLSWDDWQVDQVADELALGREHVLSREGRLDAADRWLAGEGGPFTEMAKLAPAHCGTCGFLVRLAGSLRGAFGVCGNELAPSDGRVVSVEHGCGAHSEAMADVSSAFEVLGAQAAVYDDGDEIETVEQSEIETVEVEQPELFGPSDLLVPSGQDVTEETDADAGDTGP